MEPPTRTRVRQRSRRKAKSSMSLRLNPDFQIQKCLPTNMPPSFLEDYAGNMDPRNMHFDDLTQLLQPSFIHDHLLKLLHFLKTNQKEICFPDLEPHRVAFLVKIAEFNDNLRCPVFNDDCADVSAQILDILEENKDIFRLVYGYEVGLLVYRKLELTKLMQSSLIPSSSRKQKFQEHILSLPTDGQEIPTSFRIQMLNITLRFIKDDTQLVLGYPDMPIRHAQFVYFLIHQSDNGISLYAPLYECMEKYRSKYEFEASFVETEYDNIVGLQLQKVPLKDKRRVLLQNVPFPNIQKDKGVKQMTHEEKEQVKYERDYEKRKRLVDMLPESFFNHCLTKTVEFMEDKYRASIEFPNIDRTQAKFLAKITVISRSEEQYEFHTTENVELMCRLTRSYDRDTVKLNIQYGKIDKVTGLRTITFSKMPVFKDQLIESKRQEPASKKVKIKRTECLPQKSLSSTSLDQPAHNEPVVNRHRSVSKDPMKAGGKMLNIKLTESLPQKSLSSTSLNYPAYTDPVIDRHKSVSKDLRNHQKVSSIAFESAGSMDSSDKPMFGVNRSCDVIVPVLGRKALGGQGGGRKAKLIEGLSTPVECDIAEKMMRRMGWDGGALGARAGGIIEPLMPALHLAPGAGLGHVKHKSQLIDQNCNVRKVLLTILLSFLSSDSQDTAVSLPRPLTNKEIRFLKACVENFNSRTKLSCGKAKDKVLINKITSIMDEELDLVVQVELSDNNREIRLQKTNEPFVPKPSKKKRKSKTDENVIDVANVGVENKVSCDQVFLLSKKIRREIDGLTKKTAKLLTYKVLFLQKIIEFIPRDRETVEYMFDRVLNTEHRKYVKGVLEDVNSKSSLRSMYSEYEKELITDIKAVVGDYFLTAQLSGPKLTLQKKIKTKTSPSDQPPPKSVRNTIAYINSVIQADDEIIDLDNDDEPDYIIDEIIENYADTDDEVEVIEDPNEIIEITDDEEEMSNEQSNGEESSQKTDLASHKNDKNDEKCQKDDGNCLESDKSWVLEEELMETDLDISKDDISVTISNESFLLRDDDVVNITVSQKVRDITVADASVEVNNNNTQENGVETIIKEKLSMDCHEFNPTSSIEVKDHTNIIKEKVPMDCDEPKQVKETVTIKEKNDAILNEEKLSMDCNELNATSSIEVKDHTNKTKEKVSMDYDEPKQAEEIVIIKQKNDANMNEEKFSMDCNTLPTSTEAKGDLRIEKLPMDYDDSKPIETISNIMKESDRNIDKVMEFDDFKPTSIVEENDDKNVEEGVVTMDFEVPNPTSTEDLVSEAPNIEKTNSNVIYVRIAPEKEPKISLDLVKELQSLISSNIDENAFLPLLKCHGVQNGALIYSCHSKPTFDWLKQTLSVASVEIETTDFREDYKLLMKIRSFIPVNFQQVFERLKVYNRDLNTEDWLVADEKVCDNCVTYLVYLNEDSFSYILNHNFSLFCGIDKVDFCYVWN